MSDERYVMGVDYTKFDQNVSHILSHEPDDMMNVGVCLSVRRAEEDCMTEIVVLEADGVKAVIAKDAIGRWTIIHTSNFSGASHPLRSVRYYGQAAHLQELKDDFTRNWMSDADWCLAQGIEPWGIVAPQCVYPANSAYVEVYLNGFGYLRKGVFGSDSYFFKLNRNIPVLTPTGFPVLGEGGPGDVRKPSETYAQLLESIRVEGENTKWGHEIDVMIKMGHVNTVCYVNEVVLVSVYRLGVAHRRGSTMSLSKLERVDDGLRLGHLDDLPLHRGKRPIRVESAANFRVYDTDVGVVVDCEPCLYTRLVTKAAMDRESEWVSQWDNLDGYQFDNVKHIAHGYVSGFGDWRVIKPEMSWPRS